MLVLDTGFVFIFQIACIVYISIIYLFKNQLVCSQCTRQRHWAFNSSNKNAKKKNLSKSNKKYIKNKNMQTPSSTENPIHFQKTSTTRGTKYKILGKKRLEMMWGAQILWVYRSRSRGISHQDEECFYNHCTEQNSAIFYFKFANKINKSGKISQITSTGEEEKTANPDQTKAGRANEVRFGGERNPASDCVSNGRGL